MSLWTRSYGFWCRFRRWVAGQSLVFWFFLAPFAFGLILLISSATLKTPCFSEADKVALSVGLFGGAVVWWQGYLITRQMVLGAVIDLYKEWNSEDMLEKRSAAWTSDGPDPHTIEDVLEFLEKVSTLQKNRFVTRQLVWDTFGWYIGRYYFYCIKTIDELRKNWTPKGDPTLYQDLEKFYPILVRLEVEQRNEKAKSGCRFLTPADIEEEYRHGACQRL
jgi:hypothetical protein